MHLDIFMIKELVTKSCTMIVVGLTSSPLCRYELVWTFLSRRAPAGSWTPGQ